MSLPLALLLSSVLLGFDVLKTDALGARIGEVTTRAEGSVLVAAAGGDAFRALSRLQKESGAAWEVERVPLMGDVDSEMARVLKSARKRCGLRIAAGGLEGEWIVSEHGSCGQGSAASAEDPGWLPGGEAGQGSRGERGRAERDAEPSGAEAPVGTLDPATLLLLEHTVPDPTTALLSSAIVGFGTGHFYAHDSSGGWLHAGAQAGGLALFGLGQLLGNQAFTPEGEKGGKALSAVGMVICVGSRLVDTATAPRAAAVDARRQIERQLR